MGKIYAKEAVLLKECANVAEKKQVKAASKAQAKKSLTLSLIIAVGLLVICKYKVFALSNLNGILSAVNLPQIGLF